MSLGRFNKNQVGLKLRAHQLPTYADNVNLLRNNINTLNKDIETRINVQKNKCIFMSPRQNAGQNWEIKIKDRLKMCHSSNIWEQQ
jgi:hypothetical protein